MLVLLPLGVSAQALRIGRLNNGGTYREDRILIIPKAGRAAQLNRLHGQSGTRVRKVFPNLGNIQVLELPAGVSALDIVQRYRQSGHVEAAELDILFHASALPDDPRFISGEQWHLNNYGQGGGVPHADINAPDAWNILSSASNIVVAIIDSGVRLTHQDLAANLWTNSGEIPGNGIDDDHNGVVDDVHGINTVNDTGNPNDDYGHGTHVAGILGAVGNNGIGVSGVAWRVQIMPLKFLDNFGNGSLSDVLLCLDYARTNGAKVINCSFTVARAVLSANQYQTLSNAFWSIRTAGIFVTAAAGNNGTDNDASAIYPASFGRDGIDNVIAVGATTRTDDMVYNYGATSVHLAAPGYDILSTYNSSDSSYYTESGTSMATPCVAGAVALLSAKFPNLSYRQIIDRLLGTVDPLPSLAGRCITGGRLNLANALSGGYTIQPAPYSWVPTNGMTPIVLADDGVSTAHALPFTFPFGGRHYTNLYVGANGLLGFTNLGLGSPNNTNLPLAASPNAIVCPFWDNLNPAAGGSVWLGTEGVEPYRSVVVSWVDVPHFVTTGGQTRFTFQAILHESGQIAFQYAQVQSGNAAYVRGLSATIGVEDFLGAVAANYSFNGSPEVVTNNQTILFIPHGNSGPAPSLTRLGGPQGSQLQLRVTAQLGSRCVIKASDDLTSWTSLATNVILSSGVWNFTDTNVNAHFHRFYRAASEP